MHLIALHQTGSNNPEGLPSNTDRIKFHPYFTSKDLVGFVLFAIFLSYFIFYDPNVLGHPDNSIPANSLSTPSSIVPEWYFLPFYAILRSIPSKAIGVCAKGGSLLILLLLPFFHSFNLRSNKYRPFLHFAFWIFVFNFFCLAWLGQLHIAEPYTTMSQICTFIYFSYFILLMLIG